MMGRAAAGSASSAPAGYCYGNTFGRRKREQALPVDRQVPHSIESSPTPRLECGGLPPLSRAHRRRRRTRTPCAYNGARVAARCCKLFRLERYASQAIRCARSQSRCANALRALSRPDGHRRDQDEVLRRILRLQRLPRSARRPPDRSLAAERMDAESNSLRRMRHGANHTSIHAVRVPLPQLPRAIQLRLPQPLPFLFRQRTANKDTEITQAREGAR